MRLKIIDPKYINTGKILLYLIQSDEKNVDYELDLIKSIENKSKVQADDIFECIDSFCPDGFNSGYVVIKNETGTFIVREDNVKLVNDDPKDILENYGFHKLIRGGNKTILIDEYGHKYSTTRDEEDVDDPEKAVMILLLKKEGYNIKDIYAISELIKK